MSTNVIKRTPAAGGPSYNPGDAFHVPDQGQYGQRHRDFHVGIDYAAPAGTQIPAASSGEVVYSGPSGGFRYAVMVKSIGPNGVYYSVYGHVDPAGAVPVGTKVSIGQPIGAVGTPHPDEGELSTGPHFHFEIATEEALHGAKIRKIPGDGGLGFRTGQTEVFENPNQFKGWARADQAPYNALTYIPIRDGVAYQPVPHLAQTLQAGQLPSGTSSFDRVGISPAEINRFYAETRDPSTDPSGSLGNGVSGAAISPSNAMAISPAELDRLYNFTQLGRAATTPATVDGMTPLNQTASMPWYSSPAVTGNDTPADNFSWNNVPTGGFGFSNRDPSPAGPGGAPSPIIREPRTDRRSAAPDTLAPAALQGAAFTAPAFQQNAMYSPASDFPGSLARMPTAAPVSSPAALNAPPSGFDPRTTGEFDALAQRLARHFTGAGQFVGNSLLPPAEAASLPRLLSGPIAPDLPGGEAQEIITNKPLRYLRSRIANPSPAAALDSIAPTAPALRDSFNDRFGDWTSSPAGSAPNNPNQPGSAPRASRALGLFTGEPVPNYPAPPPISGFLDDSTASGDGESAEDWFNRWIRPLIQQ